VTTGTIGKPEATEHHPYYGRYIELNPEDDVLAALDAQMAETLAFLRSIPEERSGHRYAPEKWSIRQIVGHLIDAERVFAYRALRFARADVTPVPGFDENTYAPASGADARTYADLVDEYEALRRANMYFFRALDDAAWMRIGTANDAPISVRALAWILAGHGRHHANVIRERYLKG